MTYNQTLLRRCGNKARLAHRIIKFFPTHSIYIEPFFGAGGMFFNKPKARYNLLNDLDDDVFNLYQILQDKELTEKLYEAFYATPFHESIYRHYYNNIPEDRIKRAVRFILISNFSLFGAATSTPKTALVDNTKEITLKCFASTERMLENCTIMHDTYQNVFKRITIKDAERKKAFIYADPPYHNTSKVYESNFSDDQTTELFETILETGIRFAMSEFGGNPFVEKLIRKYDLYRIKITERRSMQSKDLKEEILITNYYPSRLGVGRRGLI